MCVLYPESSYTNINIWDAVMVIDVTGGSCKPIVVSLIFTYLMHHLVTPSWYTGYKTWLACLCIEQLRVEGRGLWREEDYGGGRSFGVLITTNTGVRIL